MKKIASLYIHFPFCLKKCNYCDFHRHTLENREMLETFHRYLQDSWEKHQALLVERGHEFSSLKTLYLGGGTPSLWGQEGMVFLEDFLATRKMKLAPDCEFTLECNPKTINEVAFHTWRYLGVNRYSVGIQTLNVEILQKLGRVHELEDSLNVLALLARKKVNFSVDLMLGLPFSLEQKRDVIEEIAQILTFNPNHLSVYILTPPENYLHAQRLPDEEWIEREYLAVSSYLKERGYQHYEVSNFARPGFESRHNLMYWQSAPVAALGPSATGFLPTENGAFRYKWNQEVLEFEGEELSPEKLRLEKFYMNFRTNRGVVPSEYFSGQELESFLKIAENWRQRSLIQSDLPGIQLTSRGYLLMDSLMDEIFLKNVL